MDVYVVLAIAAVVILWFVVTYNGFVQLRNQVRNAWSQIDVQLKRRHDLIPNLIESVKGYMAHESETLERVIQARAQAVGARGVGETAAAEGALTRAIGGLFALAEAYPDLKASQNFGQLQEELVSTENRVGFARQHYNDRVMELNTRIESIPSSLVASLGGFRREELFEIEDAQERAVPRVQF